MLVLILIPKNVKIVNNINENHQSDAKIQNGKNNNNQKAESNSSSNNENDVMKIVIILWIKVTHLIIVTRAVMV